MGKRNVTEVKSTPIGISSVEFWRKVKHKLTEKQWDWVYYNLIKRVSIKENYELRGFYAEAVKSRG